MPILKSGAYMGPHEVTAHAKLEMFYRAFLISAIRDWLKSPSCVRDISRAAVRQNIQQVRLAMECRGLVS